MVPRSPGFRPHSRLEGEARSKAAAGRGTKSDVAIKLM